MSNDLCGTSVTPTGFYWLGCGYFKTLPLFILDLSNLWYNGGMTFSDFYNQLLNIDKKTSIKIKDKDHEIVFVASYFTKNYPDEEYVKVFLSDGTILQATPGAEEVYFCDDSLRAVDRSLITDGGEHLNIGGKQYTLENGDDQQLVKKIYFGNLSDGEGECVFSDYSCGDEVWSLAILPNGEFSDVHAKKIDLADVPL